MTESDCIFNRVRKLLGRIKEYPSLILNSTLIFFEEFQWTLKVFYHRMKYRMSTQEVD